MCWEKNGKKRKLTPFFSAGGRTEIPKFVDDGIPYQKPGIEVNLS